VGFSTSEISNLQVEIGLHYGLQEAITVPKESPEVSPCVATGARYLYHWDRSGDHEGTLL
jgi:hypothetical protein